MTDFINEWLTEGWWTEKPMTDKKITDGLNEKALEAAGHALAKHRGTTILDEVDQRGFNSDAAAAVSAYLNTNGLNEAPPTLLHAIECILDEESAWIARPNKEVSKRVAIAAASWAQVFYEPHEAIEGDVGELVRALHRLMGELPPETRGWWTAEQAADTLLSQQAEIERLRQLMRRGGAVGREFPTDE